MATSPIDNNPNAYYALQGYGSSNNPFNRDNVNTTPRIPREGVNGVNPQGPAAPVQGAEAYAGQNDLKARADHKAYMAINHGLGGNPHPTETLGNKLNTSDWEGIVRC